MIDDDRIEALCAAMDAANLARMRFRGNDAVELADVRSAACAATQAMIEALREHGGPWHRTGHATYRLVAGCILVCGEGSGANEQSERRVERAAASMRDVRERHAEECRLRQAADRAKAAARKGATP